MGENVIVCLQQSVYKMMSLTFVASNLRIASPTRRTSAPRMMLDHVAFGVVCAWIALGARILAHLIDAGQSGGAFTVAGAFGLRSIRLNETIDEWIAN